MAILFGCDTAFQTGTAVQSGRQALLRKDAAQALLHFEEAARRDANYVYRSANFSEGIWTYIGRCQYATGNFSQAQRSLEMALTKDQDDLLARLYLGLTLLRSGDPSRGQTELRQALQSLHDWIENLLASRSAETYWDLNQQIRMEIKKTLALMAATSGDRMEVLGNAEWLGAEVEEEIERVRREESQRTG
jgi:tetratricopeptide (TPR) repeat protein